MNDAAREALSRAGWRKSSYSEMANNCVEVAITDDAIGVRDSKLGAASPILTYTPAEWAAFVEGIRAGELSS